MKKLGLSLVGVLGFVKQGYCQLNILGLPSTFSFSDFLSDYMMLGALLVPIIALIAGYRLISGACKRG